MDNLDIMLLVEVLKAYPGAYTHLDEDEAYWLSDNGYFDETKGRVTAKALEVLRKFKRIAS